MVSGRQTALVRISIGISALGLLPSTHRRRGCHVLDVSFAGINRSEILISLFLFQNAFF